ncbi:dna replication licensing factor mcm4 [Hordeum vulgare]|nr:dna replication licensing factor mcm4 [Hordeum vulgare]
MEKEDVAPMYIRGGRIIGESMDLLKVYDIMHRVFCNVLISKVGNQDDIHGYMVDLLVAMHTEAGSGATFDVSKWMWEEMPGETLSSCDNLTVHEIKQLRKNNRALPRIPPNQPEDIFATSSDNDFELEAGAKPSWATKLTDKVRKTLFLQAHLQKKLYNAHVNEKLARQRNIHIMQALQIQIESGYQKTITQGEKWICEHNNWTDDEASGHLATPSSARATDTIMEDDEEPHDGDDSKETKESEEDD